MDSYNYIVNQQHANNFRPRVRIYIANQICYSAGSRDREKGDPRSSVSEQLERLNRALAFVGDPVERWNNRLRLEREGCSYVEDYCSGRLALILQFDSSTIEFAHPNSTAFIHKEPTRPNSGAAIIFKAHVLDHHKLQRWDEQLVFVHDVQVVQSPEKCIPSLVGFNAQHQIDNRRSDLLLFQRWPQVAIYQLFPRIVDWEPSPIGWKLNNLKPKVVERTAEIVKNVSNSKGDFSQIERASIQFDADKILSRIRIVLDRHDVKVSIRKFTNERLNLPNVFLGPLNLAP